MGNGEAYNSSEMTEKTEKVATVTAKSSYSTTDKSNNSETYRWGPTLDGWPSIVWRLTSRKQWSLVLNGNSTVLSNPLLNFSQ